MSGSFQTGASSIDLSGSPWNVATTVKLFVLLDGEGHFSLFRNEACTDTFVPPDMTVWNGVSTGLYFYIAPGSPSGTLFCDGEQGRPLPVKWLASEACPPTVTYGKIKADRKSFSMSDLATSAQAVRHPFDLEIETPGGNLVSLLANLKVRRSGDQVHRVDPTIVQKGEEPPGGGGGPDL